MTIEKIAFDTWYKKVVEIFEKQTSIKLDESNELDWKFFYDDDYSPEDAVAEELSYWGD